MKVSPPLHMCCFSFLVLRPTCAIDRHGLQLTAVRARETCYKWTLASPHTGGRCHRLAMPKFKANPAAFYESCCSTAKPMRTSSQLYRIKFSPMLQHYNLQSFRCGAGGPRPPGPRCVRRHAERGRPVLRRDTGVRLDPQWPACPRGKFPGWCCNCRCQKAQGRTLSRARPRRTPAPVRAGC